MASKVPSVEEYKKLLRNDMKKKVADFQKGLANRLEEVRDPKIPDEWAQIVKDKIERDGLSYSSLKRFRESPYAYVQYLIQQLEGEDDGEETESLYTGSLIDTLITEPHKFDERYFVVPEKVSRQSNQGKAVNELYEELADGKQVLTSEDLDDAYELVEALYLNEDARYYLDRIHNPQLFFSFVHKATGLKIRGAFDWEGPLKDPRDHREGPEYIVDLKTAADASSDGFPRKTWAGDLWYRGQVGVYLLYYKSRWQFPDFYQVAVENKKPYNVNVFRVPDDYRKEAIDEVEFLLQSFKHCMDNNLWHKSYNFERLNGPRYSILDVPRFHRYDKNAEDNDNFNEDEPSKTD